MTLKMNVIKLRELLKDFYILTKIRIVIFDEEFNEVLAYPAMPCPLCQLIKSTPEASQECIKSDKQACLKSLSTGELSIYKCHAGLIEACAPIKINNVIMGYVMFGQITDSKNKDVTRLSIIEHCKKYNIDEEMLKTASDKLKYKTDAQIKAAAKIMESCSCYLWISELITIAEENLAYKLDNYINNHITENLSADRLCDVLLISRSKLYETVNQQFNMGIAEYIRKKRINLAEKLLKSGLLIKEVCDMVGIYDYNYFSKVFKRETGYSPREYKKSITV